MSLFQLGNFTLHAGSESDFKIDCDALTDTDLECIAYLLAQRVGAFGAVEGIPQGGLRLAEKMQKYVTEGPLLIVDDVLTTGTSMLEHRLHHKNGIMGAVIFARDPNKAKRLPWIYPLFTMS